MKRIKWRQKSEEPSNDIHLDRYFSALKDTDYQDSFSSTQDWLVRVNQSKLNQITLKQRIYQMIKYFSMHRIRFAVISTLLVLGFIACTMPVEKEETFGYMLSGEINQKHDEAMKTIKALSWVDPSQLSVAIHELIKNQNSVEEKTKFAIVLPDAKREEVEIWKKEIEALKGTHSIVLQPLEDTIEQPVYKAAFGNIFKIRAHVSEDQVEHNVREHLELLHMSGIDVKHVTKPNGDRILVIRQFIDLEEAGKENLNQMIYEVKESDLLPKEKLKLLHEKIGDMDKNHKVREYPLLQDDIEKSKKDIQPKNRTFEKKNNKIIED